MDGWLTGCGREMVELGLGALLKKKNVFQDWWAEKAKRSFEGTILSPKKMNKKHSPWSSLGPLKSN